MSTRNPKMALFAQFAAVAKCLAHPHRLEILEQLAQGERSVEVLADRTRLSIANASQHLQQMKRVGLLVNRREGKFVYYQLVDDAILDLLAALRRIAERNVAEVDRVVRSYFHNRDNLEPISRENSCSDHGPAKLLFSMYGPKTSSLWAICLAL
jgi:ArsR family transcriptional regulator